MPLQHVCEAGLDGHLLTVRAGGLVRVGQGVGKRPTGVARLVERPHRRAQPSDSGHEAGSGMVRHQTHDPGRPVAFLQVPRAVEWMERESLFRDGVAQIVQPCGGDQQRPVDLGHRGRHACGATGDRLCVPPPGVRSGEKLFREFPRTIGDPVAAAVTDRFPLRGRWHAAGGYPYKVSPLAGRTRPRTAEAPRATRSSETSIRITGRATPDQVPAPGRRGLASGVELRHRTWLNTTIKIECPSSFGTAPNAP